MGVFQNNHKESSDNSNLVIQPALEIGKEDDQHEKEADAVADKVMMKSDNEEEKKGESAPMIQMKEEDEEEKKGESAPMIQMKEEDEEEKGESTPMVHMKEEEEEKVQLKEEDEEETPTIQKKTDGSKGGITASANIEKGINSTKGNGRSLPKDIQHEMGSKIGADFSNVKIHTDEHASQMNKEIGAKAFTHGNDIYFKNGNYNPSSDKGKHLLAHELTHTVQQSKSIQKYPEPEMDTYDGEGDIDVVLPPEDEIVSVSVKDMATGKMTYQDYNVTGSYKKRYTVSFGLSEPSGQYKVMIMSKLRFRSYLVYHRKTSSGPYISIMVEKEDPSKYVNTPDIDDTYPEGTNIERVKATNIVTKQIMQDHKLTETDNKKHYWFAFDSYNNSGRYLVEVFTNKGVFKYNMTHRKPPGKSSVDTLEHPFLTINVPLTAQEKRDKYIKDNLTTGKFQPDLTLENLKGKTASDKNTLITNQYSIAVTDIDSFWLSQVSSFNKWLEKYVSISDKILSANIDFNAARATGAMQTLAAIKQTEAMVDLAKSSLAFVAWVAFEGDAVADLVTTFLSTVLPNSNSSGSRLNTEIKASDDMVATFYAATYNKIHSSFGYQEKKIIEAVDSNKKSRLDFNEKLKANLVNDYNLEIKNVNLASSLTNNLIAENGVNPIPTPQEFRADLTAEIERILWAKWIPDNYRTKAGRIAGYTDEIYSESDQEWISEKLPDAITNRLLALGATTPFDDWAKNFNANLKIKGVNLYSSK